MIRLSLIFAILIAAFSVFAWDMTQKSNSKISENIKAAICAGLPNC